MFNRMCKKLHHARSAITVASSLKTTQNVHFLLQIHRFSSSSLRKPINTTPNQQHSFTVNYLMNSCGFTPEKAVSASKHMNFKNPDKPDSVLAFLNNHGFSKTQISIILQTCPRVLQSNPRRTLLPKIIFFKSKGFSCTDISKTLTSVPIILKRSLKNTIIPAFNFFQDLIQSEEKTILAIKRNPCLCSCVLEDCIAPKIEILQEAGVPNANIVVLLTRQPRVFMTSSDSFRQVVKEVEKMGFNPLRMMFLLAVQVLRAMSKPIWEKKVEAYKKWGWSEDEILVAFWKNPLFMLTSEDKLMAVMEFLVNKMGWESSLVARRPGLIALSLEKRIIPRCAVYQVLLSKGLIKKEDICPLTLLQYTEMNFLKRFVKHYEEEAPELLKLYKERLALAK